MSEEQFETAPVPQPSAEQAEKPDPTPQREKPNRGLWGLIGLLALITLIILVLLLLQDCGRQASGDGAAAKGKEIVSVNGLAPVEGAVSIWVKPGRDINDVIENSGVRVIDYIDMNGGRFVLLVRQGAESQAVQSFAALKEDVYDAGLVYEKPSGEE